MVQAVALTAARRLLIGKCSQLCRASSRQHLHWDGLPVKIDSRIPVLPESFWKPAFTSFTLPRRWSSSFCLRMVNKTVQETQNGCENSVTQELHHQVKELTIPLPWGNLAAKAWGTPNDHPILALHGWQDNAGTFDKLIPLLPKDFYVVCLDFSGHGLSDHYPAGLMYHYWDKITDIRLVADYFGWKCFSILGHSMGAIVGSMFTAVAPHMVDRLVMIDIVKPISTPATNQPEKSAKAVEGYVQILKKLQQDPPRYTYEVARERLVQANNGSIDAEAAEVLMRRGLKKHEDGSGYYFSRDLRLVIPTVASYTAEQHAEYAKRVRCPLLLIKAKNGFTYEDNKLIDEFVNIYREVSLGGFQYAEVEGTHHVHLVNPENVAQLVTKFFSREEQ